ncbi:hypothetical protein TrLO_g1703 [Triparma laevis f. longispina]|uniref:BspA family leucine-rich repeat surface protein n=1 Tax=Triparma laevis f. longispina TaxID=1714387 RepID=A0A9W7FRG3_9STRA|nr:hypothetical protein TrLO_g1703 [Triparma laevis f. longispina]
MMSIFSTGNCMTIRTMFQDAKSFKSDLNGWNVEKVTDMTAMFHLASSFASDLLSWSTGNCTNMYAMFGGASSFNRGTIRNWDLSSITGSSVDTLEGKQDYTREQCMPLDQCMPLHFK